MELWCCITTSDENTLFQKFWDIEDDVRQGSSGYDSPANVGHPSNENKRLISFYQPIFKH